MDRKAQQRSPVYFKSQAGNKREAGYLWSFWNSFCIFGVTFRAQQSNTVFQTE